MLKYKKIKGNLIHNTAVINWKNLIIGKNNVIGPYVVIGNSAQYPGKKSSGKIFIGSRNIINEYCNIHLPTTIRKKTVIGNDNYIMNSCTIDHDTIIENNVIISSNVVMGGSVHLMKNCQIGMKSIIHQNQVIGSYSMIGMGSIITKNTKILPGYLYYGKPAKKIKKNYIGLKRNRVSAIFLKKELKRFNNLI